MSKRRYKKLKSYTEDLEDLIKGMIGGADDDGVFDVVISRLDYELLVEALNNKHKG